MIKVENIEVWGFEHAIRGMRNPLNSWDRSDSYHAVDCGKCGRIEREVSAARKSMTAHRITAMKSVRMTLLLCESCLRRDTRTESICGRFLSLWTSLLRCTGGKSLTPTR